PAGHAGPAPLPDLVGKQAGGFWYLQGKVAASSGRAFLGGDGARGHRFRPGPKSTANESGGRRAAARFRREIKSADRLQGWPGAPRTPGVRLRRVMSAAQFFSFGAGRVTVSTVANATRVV